MLLGEGYIKRYLYIAGGYVANALRGAYVYVAISTEGRIKSLVR